MMQRRFLYRIGFCIGVFFGRITVVMKLIKQIIKIMFIGRLK